ncbi:3-phosphoshikimate 1-carboxyvinyltransferase [Alteribacillus persepolensis]|uniref:3-phosphoshikimate 1-carboxyvinyltransferase n=1 Tax=Alteribacillus persepolensis TaxID=568899 RepID=A0A1G8G453_9BACI|nr:3-phosphoshikimate 1-carboxyvinyltransferase [Alteribacillus persepolensis]SDH89164.1 3-phosphoshikimate 1-carboxyvinyltransferase [Alteribacillus persepolensis]
MGKPDLKARSPWAALTDVNRVDITPLHEQSVQTTMTVPGSKSFTNRALIIAALADGTSELSGILRSDDSYWCIDALRKLGVPIEVNGDTVKVEGKGGQWPEKNAGLYIGAAGTIARFLPGALACAAGGTYKVEASKRMSERPVQPLMEALESLGAHIHYEQSEGYYPLTIDANGLTGGEVTISGKVSSQFISGLLIAGPYAKEELRINIPDYIVQHAYVKITLDLMNQFGVETVYNDDLTDMRVPVSKYKGKNMALEADASTASYFFALAAITNGRIRINNLSMDTNQPDIYMADIYEKMGCRVIRGEDYIEVEGVEQLQGGFTISMKEMSDQTLTLAAIAPFADGPITITDVEHIRHHESDRIKAICTELSKMGIQVEEFQDGLKVHPGTPKGTTLQSYDDHRVAMALSLIGTKVPGVSIDDPGCVSKTCPTFYELLEKTGVSVRFA